MNFDCVLPSLVNSRSIDIAVYMFSHFSFCFQCNRSAWAIVLVNAKKIFVLLSVYLMVILKCKHHSRIGVVLQFVYIMTLLDSCKYIRA